MTYHCEGCEQGGYCKGVSVRDNRTLSVDEAFKALIECDYGEINSKILKDNEKFGGGTINQQYKEDDGKGNPPFFCEMTLYTLLGKEEARTMLGLLRQLGEAAGVSKPLLNKI